MWFEQVLFFVAGLGAIGGALGVVMLRNPFYSVLALVAHLIALAVLFLLLRAEFLAAAQVVVYAGAVMVLYVFVVAYVGGSDEPLRPEGGAIGSLGPLFAVALLIELTIAVVGSGLGAARQPGRGHRCRLRIAGRDRRAAAAEVPGSVRGGVVPPAVAAVGAVLSRSGGEARGPAPRSAA